MHTESGIKYMYSHNPVRCRDDRNIHSHVKMPIKMVLIAGYGQRVTFEFVLRTC